MDKKICGSHSAFCKWLPNEIPLRAVILKVWPEDSGFLKWKKASGILKTYNLPIGITFRLIHLVTPSLGIAVEPEALALTNSETHTFQMQHLGQAARGASKQSTSSHLWQFTSAPSYESRGAADICSVPGCACDRTKLQEMVLHSGW